MGLPGKRIPAHIKESVVIQYGNGFSAKQVAADHDVSIHAVYAILRKYNTQLHREPVSEEILQIIRDRYEVDGPKKLAPVVGMTPTNLRCLANHLGLVTDRRRSLNPKPSEYHGMTKSSEYKVWSGMINR